MSESEDSDILADIKALDEALALPIDEKPYLQHDSSSDVNSDNDSDYEFIDSDHVDESLNAYEINKRLLKSLMITKKGLTSTLHKCEQKIKELDRKINTKDESTERVRLLLTTTGMPYFKDKDGFSVAPKNNDVKLKESRGELFLLNLAKPCRWSGKDRETLLRAIQNEAIESVLNGDFGKERDKRDNQETSTSKDQVNKNVTLFPETVVEMVGAVGKKEFDWYKIAATDFEDKHSPGECRSMWNVYLHPDVKKSEWTNKEDKILLRYAKECNYQDWDTIATKLNTKRSAYQCFIRYNTVKISPCFGHSWTKKEDKHLALVLNMLRIENYIPWSEVATYMQYRTKQQVYTRWTYRKAPHLIKGRFTHFETDTLMKAVRKYGTNFCKISNIVMPHRTSMQLNDHYKTILTNRHKNVWTVSDDKKLIQLHTKYGNEWSKIAKHFSLKSRTQLRHRYKAILKYIMRGITLEKIPRRSASTNSKNTTNTKNVLPSKESRQLLKQVSVLSHADDILPRLFETLSFPPLSNNAYFQELYNPEHLTHDTKQLYKILSLLDANLNIPENFFNYAHINEREKQLLVSLEKYINARKQCVQNNEIIEEFSLRMFGPVLEVDTNSHFIPPPPFEGYIKKKNLNETESINCNLDLNQKFLIDVPTEMITPHDVTSFLDAKEEKQFLKISQLLISDTHNWKKQNTNLYRRKGKLVFNNKSTQSSSKYNKSNINSRTHMESKTKARQTNKTCATNNAAHSNTSNEETDITNGILSPSNGSLLGLKNLLLWKLLYEYENESYLTLQDMKESKQMETSPEYKRAYDTLRTRLLQIFKLPICLSNTILHIQNLDKVSSTKKHSEQRTTLEHKKQQSEDVGSIQQNKDSRLNIFAKVADSNIKQNVKTKKEHSDIKTMDLPVIRSCETVCTKYKIITK